MKRKIPRSNSLVKFNFLNIPKNYHNKYPFKKDEVYLYLGEIPNMRGHCAVVSSKTGKVFVGYHIENFIELSE